MIRKNFISFKKFEMNPSEFELMFFTVKTVLPMTCFINGTQKN